MQPCQKRFSVCLRAAITRSDVRDNARINDPHVTCSIYSEVRVDDASDPARRQCSRSDWMPQVLVSKKDQRQNTLVHGRTYQKLLANVILKVFIAFDLFESRHRVVLKQRCKGFSLCNGSAVFREVGENAEIYVIMVKLDTCVRDRNSP